MKKLLSIGVLGLALTGCGGEPEYFVADLTEVEALTNCQLQIQPQLKVPKSMDVELSGAQYIKPPEKENHEVWFQFYADNSFGGQVHHTAMCSFDNNGNIIESRFEQNS